MLTVLLVWTIALGSLSIFLAGMIFPELSRKNDLIWVGVGLFYALLLWANKGNMGGGLLLGQTAGVSLTVWLGWQAMTQRRELTAPDKKTPVPDWLQKMIDVVVPLWEKAYGAIASQLGLQENTGEASESGDALGGIKSQVMGFLDKLNNKPEDRDAATEAPEAATDDIEDDWEEEPETDEADERAEATATDDETAPEPDVETVAEVVAEPATPEETEAAPVATGEPEPAELESQAEPIAEPMAEAVPEPEAAVEEPAAEPEAAATTNESLDTAPVNAQTQSEATAQAEETEPMPSESTPQEESNWPNAEAMNAGDTPQEESNWPPNEPVD